MRMTPASRRAPCWRTSRPTSAPRPPTRPSYFETNWSNETVDPRLPGGDRRARAPCSPTAPALRQPSAASTGPAPRPRPTGTATWTAPCARASAPPRRSRRALIRRLRGQLGGVGSVGQPPGGGAACRENVAASRRFIEEAFNQGKLGVIDEIAAEDFVDHDPMAGDQDAEAASSRSPATARRSRICTARSRT